MPFSFVSIIFFIGNLVVTIMSVTHYCLIPGHCLSFEVVFDYRDATVVRDSIDVKNCYQRFQAWLSLSGHAIQKKRHIDSTGCPYSRYVVIWQHCEHLSDLELANLKHYVRYDQIWSDWPHFQAMVFISDSLVLHWCSTTSLTQFSFASPSSIDCSLCLFSHIAATQNEFTAPYYLVSAHSLFCSTPILD